MNDLKPWREKEGYTLAKLAELTGYGASYLSEVERGIKGPSFGLAQKLYQISNEQLNLLGNAPQ